MNLRSTTISGLACALIMVCAGCRNALGKPGPDAERPEQVLAFPVLYAQNCAACHGERGKNGAAISLANPVYLAVAGVDALQSATANGVAGSAGAGTLMPAFSKSKGGMLTDQQIGVLVRGMVSAWGKPGALDGQTAPAYSSGVAGDAMRGKVAFAGFCARCHGVDGGGVSQGALHTGSLVDPAYLALISDQGLRSWIVAGQPDEGMPDWRSDQIGTGARAMTDQEISDVVAWLAAQRVATPGQVYGHP